MTPLLYHLLARGVATHGVPVVCDVRREQRGCLNLRPRHEKLWASTISLGRMRCTSGVIGRPHGGGVVARRPRPPERRPRRGWYRRRRPCGVDRQNRARGRGGRVGHPAPPRFTPLSCRSRPRLSSWGHHLLLCAPSATHSCRSRRPCHRHRCRRCYLARRRPSGRVGAPSPAPRPPSGIPPAAPPLCMPPSGASARHPTIPMVFAADVQHPYTACPLETKCIELLESSDLGFMPLELVQRKASLRRPALGCSWYGCTPLGACPPRLGVTAVPSCL